MPCLVHPFVQVGERGVFCSPVSKMVLGARIISIIGEAQMADSALILHKGGRTVTEAELKAIPIPAATATWFPISHAEVLGAVRTALQSAGYEIQREQLSVAHEGHRFFGTLDLTATINEGISLAVGIRNSTDKSFPLGWCCGNRVFVCDNLSFTSEIVIAKKHTRFGQERYLEALATAVASLPSYQTSASSWIDRLRTWSLTPEQADSIILRSYEEGLIGARTLPDLIHHWRQPQHDAFKDSTGWSLWNAYTSVLRTKQETQPAAAALTTIRLQRLLSPEVSHGEVNAQQAV